MGRELLHNFVLRAEGKTKLFMLMTESGIIAFTKSKSGSKLYKNQITNFRVWDVNQGTVNLVLQKMSRAPAIFTEICSNYIISNG